MGDDVAGPDTGGEEHGGDHLPPQLEVGSGEGVVERVAGRPRRRHDLDDLRQRHRLVAAERLAREVVLLGTAQLVLGGEGEVGQELQGTGAPGGTGGRIDAVLVEVGPGPQPVKELHQADGLPGFHLRPRCRLQLLVPVPPIHVSQAP